VNSISFIIFNGFFFDGSPVATRQNISIQLILVGLGGVPSEGEGGQLPQLSAGRHVELTRTAFSTP
jgi:hypothetical protein